MLNSFAPSDFKRDDCISFPILDEVIRPKANCKSSSRTKCTFPVIAQSYENAIDKSFYITLDLKSKKRFFYFVYSDDVTVRIASSSISDRSRKSERRDLAGHSKNGEKGLFFFRESGWHRAKCPYKWSS